MASIKKRPDGAWRARYRDDAGKEWAKHFPRKKDAEDWLEEVATYGHVIPSPAKRKQRTPTPPRRGFVNFEETQRAVLPVLPRRNVQRPRPL